jgi:hypothetical protein
MRAIGGSELATLLRAAPGATSRGESGRDIRTPVPLPGLAARKGIVRKLLNEWASLAEKSAPECAWDRASGEPGADPTALSIGYLVEPRSLMEARRLRRLDRHADAREASLQMLARAGRRLRDLAERSCDEE